MENTKSLKMNGLRWNWKVLINKGLKEGEPSIAARLIKEG